MNNVKRFTAKHFCYHALGAFIAQTRHRLKIPIHDLCLESNIGKDTYYKLVAGHDHNLNVYIRLFECFAMYSEPVHYQRLLYEFSLLSRAELCAKRNMDMDEEMQAVWSEWKEVKKIT